MQVIVVSLAAVLLALALLLSGHGLMTILVPIRATQAGWGDTVIGLLGSLYYVGFVAGCVFGPHVILAAGHIRTFSAVLALCVASVLFMALFENPWAWLAARLVVGAAMACVFLVAESWINERADAASRGTVIAVYVSVIYISLTAGQFLLGAGEAPTTPFILAAMLLAVAVVPVALTRSEQPAPIAIVRFEPGRLYRLSPVGVIGTGVNGMMMSVFYALAPTYALSRGIDGTALPLFTGASLLAGAAMQVPIGRLSDRVDRRLVLFGLCAVSAFACGALAIADRETIGFGGLLALAVLFGAATMPGYAISAAHAFDYAEVDRYVQVSAGLLLVNGLGAAISPILAGLVMQTLGAGGAFGTLGVIMLAFLCFVAIRIRRREALLESDKEDFAISVSAPIHTVVPPTPIEENAGIQAPDSTAPGVIEMWLADDEGETAIKTEGVD